MYHTPLNAAVLEILRPEFDFIEDGWADPILENIMEGMGQIGFSNLEILFSGFSSQGDGASFTGIWESREPDDEYTLNADTQLLLDAILEAISPQRRYDFTFEINRLRDIKYVHSKTVSLEMSWTCDERDSAPMEGWGYLVDRLYSAVEDHANRIYATLQESYEDLTSDEYMWEEILNDASCNEAFKERFLILLADNTEDDDDYDNTWELEMENNAHNEMIGKLADKMSEVLGVPVGILREDTEEAEERAVSLTVDFADAARFLQKHDTTVHLLRVAKEDMARAVDNVLSRLPLPKDEE